VNTRSIVVQDDPRQRRRHRLLLGIAALTLFVLGILLGGWGNLYLGLESAWENRQLRADIVKQARELEALHQWKSDAETRQEIDRAALEMVRSELAEQQETIAELEKGVHFYRSIMAPGELSEGLSVHSIDLKPVPDGAYQFRVLVQQSSRKHQLLTGTLKVLVHGERNGEHIAYNLSDLSEQVPEADIRLRFKYFQAIDGELELPDEFIPKMVSTTARSNKPRRVMVETEFPWSVQEKISHDRQ
jgi:hypothetical protein